jgi:hypothetical protein
MARSRSLGQLVGVGEIASRGDGLDMAAAEHAVLIVHGQNALFYWVAGGSPSGLSGARMMRAISSMGAWGRCQVGVNPSGTVAPT